MSMRMDLSHIHASGPACGACRTSPPLDFEFSFAFQPIVDVRRRDVFSYEALVRGSAGEGARSVLDRVNDTNRYRFDQTCRIRALDLAKRLRNTKRTNINFLPHAIYRPEVCLQTTIRAAKSLQIPTESILFEIVECENAVGDGRLAEIVREYKRLGFQTALDDFGAGYAGLNLLAEFEPDFVKLDMGLIRNIDSSPRRRAIVSGVLDICLRLEIGVIAEGIESFDEYRWLREAGVVLFQGYYFARPAFEALPFVDFNACLDKRSKPSVPLTPVRSAFA